MLQGFAEGCKTRIPKPFLCLGLAQYCRVLRPRWCQSGVAIVLVSASMKCILLQARRELDFLCCRRLCERTFFG